jgi:hypothetical protein
VGFVIDVKPLAPRLLRYHCGPSYQLLADALVLVVGVYCGVQDEGVRAPVPAHVDEPDERLVVEGADPRQTVAFEPLPPELD